MKRSFLISGMLLTVAAVLVLRSHLQDPLPEARKAAAVPPPARSPASSFLPSIAANLPERPGLEHLDALRSRLWALPAEQALEEIRSFLESGDDRATGLSFEIGGDGSLSGWPTLRVFLLDLLQGIDPAAAARIRIIE